MNGPGDERGAAHARWHDDIAAYSLGSLGPEDAEALERHLAGCEECRERLEWLSPAVGVLAESVPRVDPPAGLKRRVMADVGADATSRRRSARWDWLRNLPLRPAAALAAIAILAAGIGGYALRGGDGTVTDRGSAAGVVATLEHDEGSGTLQLTGLRQLDSEHLYQAWIQRDREIQPSSLFAPHADGSASTAIPAGLEGANEVMVTVEPRQGSTAPSSAPLIRIPVN